MGQLGVFEYLTTMVLQVHGNKENGNHNYKNVRHTVRK